MRPSTTIMSQISKQRPSVVYQQFGRFSVGLQEPPTAILYAEVADSGGRRLYKLVKDEKGVLDVPRHVELVDVKVDFEQIDWEHAPKLAGAFM